MYSHDCIILKYIYIYIYIVIWPQIFWICFVLAEKYLRIWLTRIRLRHLRALRSSSVLFWKLGGASELQLATPLTNVHTHCNLVIVRALFLNCSYILYLQCKNLNWNSLLQFSLDIGFLVKEHKASLSIMPSCIYRSSAICMCMYGRAHYIPSPTPPRVSVCYRFYIFFSFYSICISTVCLRARGM